MTQTPPGWYPDHNGQQRYWDGERWTEHVGPQGQAEPTVVIAPPPPPPPPYPATNTGPTGPAWYQRKAVWVAGVVVALVAIGSVASGEDEPEDATAKLEQPAATMTVTAPAQPAEPAQTKTVTAQPNPKPQPQPLQESQVGNDAPADGDFFTMPDERGKRLQAAQDDLQAITGNPFFFSDSEDATGAGRFQVLDSGWQVCSQRPRAGARVSVDADNVMFSVVRVSETCP